MSVVLALACLLSSQLLHLSRRSLKLWLCTLYRCSMYTRAVLALASTSSLKCSS